MSPSIYIPERFKRVIHLHIIKNMLIRPPARETLFLGIHGPSGDGKTFQCEQVLPTGCATRCKQASSIKRKEISN